MTEEKSIELNLQKDSYYKKEYVYKYNYLFNLNKI